MHSVLPLDPRVKQPALHFHTCINSQAEESIPLGSHSNTTTPITLGFGTRPVTIGSRRRRAECTEHFGVISVFVCVRFACGYGKKLLHLNVIRNCSKCYRTLREPTVPICIGFFTKPCLKNGKITPYYPEMK